MFFKNTMNQLIKLGLFSTCLYSSAVLSSDIFVTLGAFNEPEGPHAGAELSVIAQGDYASLRLSGVLFTGESGSDEKVDKLFAGYSITPTFHLDFPLSPYVGAGVFYGETPGCDDENQQGNQCNSDEIIWAFYPEAGLQFNLGGIYIAPYIRRYFDSQSEARPVNAFGLNIGTAR